MSSPFSTAPLLKNTFAILQKHLKPIMTIAGVTYFATTLVNILVVLTASPAVGLAASIVQQAVHGIATGVIALALAQTASGRAIDLNGCLQETLAALPRLIPTAAIVALAITIGLLLLLVPGIIAFALLCLSVPAAVLEKLEPADALKRSFELCKTRWNHLGGALIAVALIFGGGAMLLNYLAAQTNSAAVYLIVDYTVGSLASGAMAVSVVLAYQEITGQLGQNRA